MQARVIDRRDGSQVCFYRDWPWSPETVKLPDRFGDVRAAQAAAELNEREPEERFVVERVLPRVGQRVKVDAYNRVRRGVVTEVKVGPRSKRVQVRVLWHNARGEAHEHWYEPRDFEWAEQLLRMNRRRLS